MGVSRDEAWRLFCEWTESDSLRRHVLGVEAAMRAYAREGGEDEELWAATGILHDLDYERYPDPDTGHPRLAVAELERRDYPPELVDAVAGHAEYLGVPRTTPLARTLFAVDELSGFVAACARVRPEGIHGLTPKSVKKKLKQASFAAAVDREQVHRGAEELGVDFDTHVAKVIAAMEERATELDLKGDGSAWAGGGRHRARGRAAAMNGRERQSAVYTGGVSGRRPRVPVAPERLADAARRAMSEQAYAYVATGAGAERTMAANRDAFDRWRIVPRMLRDASERRLETELFGRTLPAPVLLAPIGVLELAHPGADLAAGRAAAAEGIPMIFSSQASRPMEEVAAAMGEAPRWFQLYWSTSNDLLESFVARAERCGCEAIVVTLDTTLLGWRPRDLDLAYLPFLRGKGIAQYTSDPVFRGMLDRPGDDGGSERSPQINLAALRTLIALTRAYPDRFLRALRSGRARAAVERFVAIYSRPSLTWEDLPFLRERTRLPIVLKGILHPDDARRALDHGMDGIVVSNHGGRQVDGAIATLDALPEILEAVDGRAPVLLDSGIRGGADAFKALALGASAVLLGRPYVYGLAVAGEAGVREVIQNVVGELDLTLGLAGGSATAELEPGALTRV